MGCVESNEAVHMVTDGMGIISKWIVDRFTMAMATARKSVNA